MPLTLDEMYIDILGEECVEVAQRCSKALRFGMEETQPGQPLDNSARIVQEFKDVYTLMLILRGRGLIDEFIPTVDEVNAKADRVSKYLEVSRREGRLVD